MTLLIKTLAAVAVVALLAMSAFARSAAATPTRQGSSVAKTDPGGRRRKPIVVRLRDRGPAPVIAPAGP